MNKTLKKFMPLIIIVVLVVIPIVISLIVGSPLGEKTLVPQVEVLEVSTDSITEELVITGIVESEKTSILFAPVNGTIASCEAKVGQVVEEHEQLVTFDESELESSYKQSELSYLQSQSEYNTTISSNNQLVKDANKATQEVDEIEAEIEDIESNMNSYENKIEKLTKSQATLYDEIEKLNGEIMEKQEVITQEQGELEELQKQLTEKQEELVTTEADLSKYTTLLESAVQDLSQQNMSLVEQEAIAQSGENAMTLDQLAVLEMSKELAELASLDAEELLQKGKDGIVAPYDGVISAVSIMEGSQVAQGMELITIASNSDVCLNIELSTDDYDKLEVGDRAEIKIKDYMYSGVVSEINQIVTTSMTGASVIGAKIEITNSDENIFLGVDGKASIITEEKENVVCIPSSVINTSTEGDFVYVIEDGVVAMRNIEIGISVLDKVEVLSGLEVGDQIISDMVTVLYEGMEVEAKLQ